MGTPACDWSIVITKLEIWPLIGQYPDADAGDGAGDVEVAEAPGLPGQQPAHTQGDAVSQDSGPPPKPAREDCHCCNLCHKLTHALDIMFMQNMVIMRV